MCKIFNFPKAATKPQTPAAQELVDVVDMLKFSLDALVEVAKEGDEGAEPYLAELFESYPDVFAKIETVTRRALKEKA